jgi:hypothetical protein
VLEPFLPAAVVILATGAALRLARTRRYRRLGTRLDGISGDAQALVAVGPRALAGVPLPAFTDRLVVLASPLSPGEFGRLAEAIERLGKTERSYLPAHKKGGTVAYETLLELAPEIVTLYQSRGLRELVSQLVGVSVVPTPLHDQSSCSVLFYERPGYHIGWHYDHNFYRGRHFTVLLPIVNCDRNGKGLSAARLVARVGGSDREIQTPPNTIVVFEGAVVLHKATPIAEGERRVVLSMTFTTDPHNSWRQGISRRIKDMAFFGPRALWT